MAEWTLLSMIVSSILTVAASRYASMNGGGQGFLKNCATPDKNFTLTWTPKDIVIGNEITVNLDFTPAFEWSKGKSCCTIEVPGCPVPVYEQCEAMTCEDVDKIFKGKCPFKPGVPFHVSHQVLKIPSDFPVPEDDYVLRCNVTDQSGKIFLCATGNVSIRDPGMLLQKAVLEKGSFAHIISARKELVRILSKRSIDLKTGALP